MDAYNRLLTVHDRGFCEEYPHQPVYNIKHGGCEECPYHVFPGDYANAEACLERNDACVFAGVIPKETTWFNTLTGENKTIPFTKHFKEQQWMECA